MACEPWPRGPALLLPVVLVPPTIESLITNKSTPEIKGTWQEGIAKTLAVTLAGRTFKFGTDPEIVFKCRCLDAKTFSAPGRWQL